MPLTAFQTQIALLLASNRPEDFSRLKLAEPVDLVAIKTMWLSALREAENLILKNPPDAYGCLFYSFAAQKFVSPSSNEDRVPHYGVPGGVLPRSLES